MTPPSDESREGSDLERAPSSDRRDEPQITEDPSVPSEPSGPSRDDRPQLDWW
jgi:hypothetical protein